ncbi:DUF4238 domain-containing protein [Sulfitobacter sp. PM12]|jgi:hypothetical protein|uniref:DUF4238 domain-containing protein n=1 Tax=Sulfitobacter sp. PM12 TaxID=3138497 RepID=UPI00388DDCEC
MPKVSKNHHYIPRSVLRQFCFEGESLLLFDAMHRNLGYRQKNVEKAFQKFHANTIDSISGEKSDFVEKWLEREVDGPLAEVLNAAKTNLDSLLTKEAKKVFAKYLVTLLFRSPRGRSFWMSGATTALDFADSIHSLSRTLDPSFATGLFNGIAPENFKQAFVTAMPTFVGDDDIEMLLECDLIFGIPKGHELFCISDFPHMRYDDPRNASSELMHENWCILSPRLALCFVKDCKFELEGSKMFLPDSFVRRINYDFAMRSQYVASNCLWQLHRTVKHLGEFVSGRDLAETRPESFEASGALY